MKNGVFPEKSPKSKHPIYTFRGGPVPSPEMFFENFFQEIVEPLERFAGKNFDGCTSLRNVASSPAVYRRLGLYHQVAKNYKSHHMRSTF